jgi:hypothetical protein
MREISKSKTGLTGVEDAGRWFVATELFERGGKKISGPYTTRQDAIVAREAIERLSGNTTYWVAQAPKVLVEVKP